jgi:hypothetical protein
MLSYLYFCSPLTLNDSPLIGGYLAHPAESFPSLFQNRFWRENPYFLPCGIAAGFSLSCCIVALLFLQEVRLWLLITSHRLTLQQTKLDTRRSKYKQLLDSESQISLISMRDAPVETGLLESAASPCEPKAAPASELSPPVRLLLTKPVLLAVLNYGLLSLLEISFLVLLPIFLAGSLHFSPSSIGLLMGIMGLANGIIQIAFFVPLHKRLGSRNLFSLGVCSIGFMFCAFPFIARFYVLNGGTLGLNVFWD